MARDVYHNNVKAALVKDGWEITDDPLELQWGDVRGLIDLAAEQVLAAERQGEKIAVEIKSFVGQSDINEFHTALGQFLNYKFLLQQLDPNRDLYLAVPLDTFDSFFQLTFPKLVVQQYQVKLLVFDPQSQEVSQWIS